MRPTAHKLFATLLLVTVVAFAESLNAASCPAKQHPTFKIGVAPELASEPLAGRLIVMMSNQPGPAGKLAPTYGTEAHDVWVAAKEVHDLTPQLPAEFDPDELAYPDKFCAAPPGSYRMKAVLDINHDFAYDYTVTDGDLQSAIVEQAFNPASNDGVSLTLTERKTDPPLQVPARTELLDFVSPALSQFWGRPIHISGAVVLPPSYSTGKNRYPTVYETHGFGGDLRVMVQRTALGLNKLTDEKKIPEMIWVLLVEAFPTGTHEFADSVNNGPWGTALTTELIPYLEKKYRMDAKPSGRFLTGHSSGGWAVLWAQVTHPGMFGGTWPTAPDPGDFRSFTRIDLTQRPVENFYRHDDGSTRMLIRMGGKDVQSVEDLALQERVLGEYGGQLASFDWVFSPRGKDGRPMPLFDRDTGRIDPEVADYWEQHYDIAALLRRDWKKIGPSLNGKIHLTVGTADTIYLNESAKLLEQTIKDLGGEASFTYMEGRSHFDLYQGGLFEQIAKEMYAVARPAHSSKPADNKTPPKP